MIILLYNERDIPIIRVYQPLLNFYIKPKTLYHIEQS